MKTLILKELRENLRLAVIGFLLSAAVVAGTQIYYLDLIKGIASGVSTAGNYYYRLQPLASGNFEAFSMLLCVVVALMLGWFQIHSERHRDLWAFLVHRPVTRTTLFLSKTIAGLVLYALAVGLPLLYFVLWVEIPGHVAAPFEWGMAWPVAGTILSGVPWYFAGMLTSIRQARWYGSRALGIGAAALALSSIFGWWFTALAVAALGLAVWGAFHNRGQFQGQPAVGKMALTLSLIPGATMVLMGVTGLALEIFLGLNSVTVLPHYLLSREGVIYKVVERAGMQQILTLDGQVLKDPNTDRPMELDKFSRGFGLGPYASMTLTKSSRLDGQSGWSHLLSGNPRTLWFGLNVGRTGRIEGYDVGTRKFIGSIGPEGFAASKEGDGSGFLPSEDWRYNGLYLGEGEPMASAKTVYRIDLENRTVKPIWTVGGDDAIKAMGWRPAGPMDARIVLTRHDIRLLILSRDSATQSWSIPFDQPVREPSWLNVYQVPNAGGQRSTSVWIGSAWMTSPFSALNGAPGPPTHVVWLNQRGEITKSEDLPPLELPNHQPDTDRIANAMLPPVTQLISPWLANTTNRPSKEINWQAVEIYFGFGLLCALLGFWLGRRYSFSAKRQAVWALFHLFFGIPGLLVFIAVQEWPARVRCPSCGKPRAVNNETCEHCGAAFPPPKKNGLEIFEVQELCER